MDTDLQSPFEFVQAGFHPSVFSIVRKCVPTIRSHFLAGGDNTLDWQCICWPDAPCIEILSCLQTTRRNQSRPCIPWKKRRRGSPTPSLSTIPVAPQPRIYHRIHHHSIRDAMERTRILSFSNRFGHWSAPAFHCCLHCLWTFAYSFAFSPC